MAKVRFMIELDSEDIAALQYPVLVEQWERVVGPYATRRLTNQYRERFSGKERETISRYKSVFHQWYLVEGPPQSRTMSVTTHQLLKNAIAFFATV